MAFSRAVSQDYLAEIWEASGSLMEYDNSQRHGQLTDCLSGRNNADVWCMVKLPPSTGCAPTVDELSEGVLRRLDYSLRERSQDPYDIEILWCVEENCYVVMACTDSEADDPPTHTDLMVSPEQLDEYLNDQLRNEDEAVYGQLDSDQVSGGTGDG